MNLIKSKNWAFCNKASDLNDIHKKGINISIFKRDITFLNKEIQELIFSKIKYQIKGTDNEVINFISKKLIQKNCQNLLTDIIFQVRLFQKITKSSNISLFLSTINSNMCRKFHTDINDLRLLCTYFGPGTLWIKDNDFISKKNNALDFKCDKENIQQVETGDISILKGSIYRCDQTSAIFHRSPSIEESGQKRLLLRLDTEKFLNHS